MSWGQEVTREDGDDDAGNGGPRLHLPLHFHWRIALPLPRVRGPYGNMVLLGSYTALDFGTPGAIFLFFLHVGPPISPVLFIAVWLSAGGSCWWYTS